MVWCIHLCTYPAGTFIPSFFLSFLNLHAKICNEVKIIWEMWMCRIYNQHHHYCFSIKFCVIIYSAFVRMPKVFDYTCSSWTLQHFRADSSFLHKMLISHDYFIQCLAWRWLPAAACSFCLSVLWPAVGWGWCITSQTFKRLYVQNDVEGVWWEKK